MRKEKKTICRFAVTCVGILAVAAVLALTPIGSKNTNPPDPSSENKESALQTGESSCPVQSVLYESGRIAGRSRSATGSLLSARQGA